MAPPRGVRLIDDGYKRWRLLTESELVKWSRRRRLTNLYNLLNAAFSYIAQRLIFVVVSNKELHKYRYDVMMNESFKYSVTAAGDNEFSLNKD